MSKHIHVAFYLRSATGNMDDLDRQRKILEKEFLRRGFDYANCSITLYVDGQCSGLRHGREMARLIEDAKDKKIHAIMVSRMNRLSRKANGLTAFFQLAKDYQIRLICENENVDSAHMGFFKREEAYENR